MLSSGCQLSDKALAAAVLAGGLLSVVLAPGSGGACWEWRVGWGGSSLRLVLALVLTPDPGRALSAVLEGTDHSLLAHWPGREGSWVPPPS